MSFYNHTRKLLINKQVDLAALKLVLTSGYTFVATETTLTNVTAAEVSGNGWTSGGEAIGSVAVTVVATNGAMIDGADISVTATGGSIGPADGYVIVDATNSFPLFHTSFTAQTAGSGTPFNVTFDANGIFRDLEPA